jgi:O-antigen/teichoic acid export membrane protein
MSLRRNIIANYCGAIAVVAGPLLAMPYYLSILGASQFGLISFVILVQMILGLLDAGLSQALVREVAIRFNPLAAQQRSAANLLYGFERIYWLFALIAGLVLAVFSKLIAEQWLNLNNLPLYLGQQAVTGAAVIFMVQFPGSIYKSLLLGSQSQVSLNSITFICAVVRHVGSVLLVMHYSTLMAYLVWHVAVGLLETAVRARFAWQLVQIQRKELHWNIQELLPAWRLTAAMLGATLLGAITVQIDKIALSRMASIEQFGYYTVASIVAGGVLQLIYPVIQAALPRVIKQRNNPDTLRALNKKLFKLIVVLVLLGACVYILIGHWLLGVWIKDEIAVEIIYPILSVLLVGTAFNAFYNVGYINWIANENMQRILLVNATSLILSVVLIPAFIATHGVIGAAVSWLVMNFIGFLISLEWLKRK